jgi:hypothetical protein
MGRIPGCADRLHSDVLDCAGELHQATHSVSAGMQSSCARPKNKRLMASRADRLHLKVLDCAGSLYQATRVVFLPSCTSASDCVRGWFRACRQLNSSCEAAYLAAECSRLAIRCSIVIQREPRLNAASTGAHDQPTMFNTLSASTLG